MTANKKRRQPAGKRVNLGGILASSTSTYAVYHVSATNENQRTNSARWQASREGSGFAGFCPKRMGFESDMLRNYFMILLNCTKLGQKIQRLELAAYDLLFNSMLFQ